MFVIFKIFDFLFIFLIYPTKIDVFFYMYHLKKLIKIP